MHRNIFFTWHCVFLGNFQFGLFMRILALCLGGLSFVNPIGDPGSIFCQILDGPNIYLEIRLEIFVNRNYQTTTTVNCFRRQIQPIGVRE